MVREAARMALWVSLGGLLSVLLMGSPGTAAAAPALSPLETLQACIDRVLQILGSSLDESGKVLRLQREVGPYHDFPEMAKRALGHHRARATKAEQAEFERLFIRVLEERYLTRTLLAEASKEVRVTYGKSRIEGDFAEVMTKFLTAKGSEYEVLWRMHAAGDAWKIYDMNLEGVSLIGNYRGQFTKMLAGGRPFAEFLTDFRARVNRVETRRE